MSKPRKNIKLRERIVDGVLTIEIGVSTLAHAAKHCETFWLLETEKDGLVVRDEKRWAKDVLAELTREGADGSTPITRLLDDAFEKAANNGSEGLDHDAMDALQAAETKESVGL